MYLSRRSLVLEVAVTVERVVRINYTYLQIFINKEIVSCYELLKMELLEVGKGLHQDKKYLAMPMPLTLR